MESAKDRTPEKRERERSHVRKAKTRKAASASSLTVRECKVCLAAVPSTFEQEHHEIPQAAGGRTGPVASLCANCHHNLHRVADMLMSNRAGLAEDSVAIMYADPGTRERLFALANITVEFLTLKKDGKLEGDEPVSVMIELPPQIKLAAQVIANDHRGATGRKLGLATWISSLVKREVYAKYPHLKVKNTM